MLNKAVFFLEIIAFSENHFGKENFRRILFLIMLLVCGFGFSGDVSCD